MLPGRQFTPEEILRILWSRIWLILVPFAIVSAGTAVYVRKLPNVYRSEALIQVVPQRVPESFVRSTVTTSFESRLGAIRETILSRTRLERIITDFGLYKDALRTGIMEDIVDRMRREISVRPVQGDAFRVSFTSGNPVTAMKVTERLAGLFIQESLLDRESLAEGTTQFLDAMVEDARARLVEREKQLEDYRRRFAGQLPTQLSSNLQALQNVALQLQNLQQAVITNQDRRLLLERQLADLESQIVAPAPVASPGPEGQAGRGTTIEQLTAARGQLAALEARWTPAHPDVERMRRTVAELAKKAEAEALQTPLSGGELHLLSPVEAERQKRITALKADLGQLTRHIESQKEEETRLRAAADGYQQRIEMAPTRESELIELTRDYNTLNSQYTNLLGKREEAKIAANLERRQIGEQFRLLDPARVPQRPVSPDRQGLTLMGMAASLGIGVVLIGLLEYRDSSLKTDDEVASLIDVPVLAVVPLMESDRDRRRTRVRWWITRSLMGATVFGCLSVLAYTFVR